nr:MAG TPA: hypothetical protein [Caudoviricetes sp.]
MVVRFILHVINKLHAVLPFFAFIFVCVRL